MNADRTRQLALDVKPEQEASSPLVVIVGKSAGRILEDGSFAHISPIAEAKNCFAFLTSFRKPAINLVDQLRYAIR